MCFQNCHRRKSLWIIQTLIICSMEHKGNRCCFTFQTGSAEPQTPARGAEPREGPGEAVGQSRPASPCLPRSHLEEAITPASTHQGAGPFCCRWTGWGEEQMVNKAKIGTTSPGSIHANVCVTAHKTNHYKLQTRTNHQNVWTTWCNVLQVCVGVLL